MYSCLSYPSVRLFEEQASLEAQSTKTLHTGQRRGQIPQNKTKGGRHTIQSVVESAVDSNTPC